MKCNGGNTAPRYNSNKPGVDTLIGDQSEGPKLVPVGDRTYEVKVEGSRRRSCKGVEDTFDLRTASNWNGNVPLR